MQVADVANNNLMMGGAGLPGWVIHLERHFARRRKHGHLTAALRFLHFAAPTPKNSSKKILLRHRQYVQLICVGLLLQGVFYRERLLLFHLKNISNRQKRMQSPVQKFFRCFFLIGKTVSPGRDFALAGHKNISFFFETFVFDQTDRRADLGHWTLCILKPENACIGISLKVSIQIQDKM